MIPWIGKHWLRIGIAAVFLFVLNRKQIDLSIQLGSPRVAPQQEVNTPEQPVKQQKEQRAEVFTEEVNETKKGNWLQQMNILSGSSYPELSMRLQKIDEQRVAGFLRRFSHVAQKEQQKYGIPASIVLANALLQSGSGTTEAARQGDNLFGLPCTADWQGPTVATNGKCYRKYDNAWTSFRDHSLYVTTGKFAEMTQLSAKDYNSWAAGLDKLNFNKTTNLEEQLLAVIEQWQLFQFD